MINALQIAPEEASQKSDAAMARLMSVKGEPLFFSEWARAVFIHYEVDAEALQQCVPFQLEMYEGKAYVSVVAFQMRRLRLRVGGRLGDWLLRPIANHGLLNVRTYVRWQGEPGIFFLAEWLPNLLSVTLGPRTFGLPYRFGRLEYDHIHEQGTLRGKVAERKTARRLSYRSAIDPEVQFHRCAPGSLEEFLLERYTAFTAQGATRRFFRVWHKPWLQAAIHVAIRNNTLLTSTWPWFKQARLIGANYSPGFEEVWMGRPRRLGPDPRPCRRGVSTFYEFP